ncbi:MAG: 4a-hydroxytetrahydrobiopterin dehydratase [Acidobacteriaceae bacterium]
MERISGHALTKALEDVPGWRVEEGSLTQTRTFKDFVEAMHFVNGAAGLAEAMGHHPDLDIRYNKVRIALTTHDAGGITELDLALAARLDSLVA